MRFLENTFDLSQFVNTEKTTEDEVKKANVVYQHLCGTHILPLQTAMAVLLSLELKKKKMAVGKLPVFRMRLSFARNFGIT